MASSWALGLKHKDPWLSLPLGEKAAVQGRKRSPDLHKDLELVCDTEAQVSRRAPGHPGSLEFLSGEGGSALQVAEFL